MWAPIIDGGPLMRTTVVLGMNVSGHTCIGVVIVSLTSSFTSSSLYFVISWSSSTSSQDLFLNYFVYINHFTQLQTWGVPHHVVWGGVDCALPHRLQIVWCSACKNFNLISPWLEVQQPQRPQYSVVHNWTLEYLFNLDFNENWRPKYNIKVHQSTSKYIYHWGVRWWRWGGTPGWGPRVGSSGATCGM